MRENKGLLHNRYDMTAFTKANPESSFKGNYCTEYGFRVDMEKHAILLRCNPTKGDYDFYCYCYVKEWLDKHGDKLITLSTCEYSAQNGRLVVVAKKVN